MEDVLSDASGTGANKNGEAPSRDRLRRLIEVGIALSSELSLEALLQQLIETAVELTGARYGALGVIDRLGTGLEQFITVGVDHGVVSMLASALLDALGVARDGRGIAPREVELG